MVARVLTRAAGSLVGEKSRSDSSRAVSCSVSRQRTAQPVHGHVQVHVLVHVHVHMHMHVHVHVDVDMPMGMETRAGRRRGGTSRAAARSADSACSTKPLTHVYIPAGNLACLPSRQRWRGGQSTIPSQGR